MDCLPLIRLHQFLAHGNEPCAIYFGRNDRLTESLLLLALFLSGFQAIKHQAALRRYLAHGQMRRSLGY